MSYLKTRFYFGETAHFWYKKALNVPYIDSLVANYAFGYTEDTIMLSEDNSHNWPYQNKFWNAKEITFSHLFKNGNILFGTLNRLYLSTDKLNSIHEIAVKDPEGNDYTPHVPKDPQYPGWYYFSLSGVKSWMIGGREILVWGNYCNVYGGAVPVNIYYSVDNGESVKLAYSFGQNPYFTDNGNRNESGEGNLLGDPNNPHYCRHVHSVMYNPTEDAFYVTTGDRNRKDGKECYWLKGRYDFDTDQWNWKVLINGDWNSRYKSGGLNFVDGQLYFNSDANGEEPYDRGVFRCNPQDLLNKEKHTLLFQPKYETAAMIIQDHQILSGHIDMASPWICGIIYSPDLGKTWFEYDLKEFGPRSPLKFDYKNEEGWFRLDLRPKWVAKGEVLFIKPK